MRARSFRQPEAEFHDCRCLSSVEWQKTALWPCNIGYNTSQTSCPDAISRSLLGRAVCSCDSTQAAIRSVGRRCIFISAVLTIIIVFYVDWVTAIAAVGLLQGEYLRQPRRSKEEAIEGRITLNDLPAPYQ